MSTQVIPPLVALTRDPDVNITPDELAAVGAALQKQVTRDFAPTWQQPATIAAFPSETAVPIGYWPIVIKNKIGAQDAAGYHQDYHHQPYALVEYSRDWYVTASHELLEMLADPWGRRLVVCDDPRGNGQRARVLVEACDPCEAYTYNVDGIPVSDFVMPAYYGPHRWHFDEHAPAAAGMFSFTGSLKAPLTVARGGYLSFKDSVEHKWWQLTWFDGAEPSIRELGRHEDEDARAPREWIDQQTTHVAKAAATARA